MGLLNNIFGNSKPSPQRRVVSVRSNYIPIRMRGKHHTPKQSVRGFEAAKIDRTNNSWNATQTNINWDIRLGLAILRARSKDLSHSDPYAKKYLNALEKYVVGPDGFTHRNKAYDMVKTNGEWKVQLDKVANKIIQDGFWRWGKREFCTITKDQSLRQALGLAQKTVAIDGEVFIKKVYVDKKINPFGFTLQLIAAGYCDETLNKKLASGNLIIMGIEYTPVGEPVAYYFRKMTEETELYSQTATREYVRISADQIYHLYRKEYVGQKRGIPWFTPAAVRLHILRGYEDAALMNARSAARKVNVIQQRKGEEGELTKSNVAGTEVDEEGNIIKDIAPGETYVIPRGYEHVSYDPSYPQGEHGSFTQTILQGVSSGLDIDYPTLSSNLSGVNYTSARHGMLDSRLGFKRMQSDMKEDLLELVHTDWLESAILNEAFPISLPMSKFEKFNQPLFLGYQPDWTDPLKDGKAKILLNQNNIETLEKICAEKGIDLEEHLDQLEFEKRELERRGLSVKSVVEEKENGENDSESRSRLHNSRNLLLMDAEDFKEAIYEILEEKRSNGHN